MFIQSSNNISSSQLRFHLQLIIFVSSSRSLLRYVLLFIVGFQITYSQAQSVQSHEVFAHRGFRGLHPENTIQAMKKTLAYGAILELDLAITADKQVVVSHDPILNPKLTTSQDGAVLEKEPKNVIYQMDYETIRTFDVGIKPNPDFPDQERYQAHIPLFKEMIDSVETYAESLSLDAPRYFVETKLNEKTDGKNHPSPQEFVDLMMQVVDEKQIHDRLIVQSFDPRTLQILRRQHPEIKLAFLARSGTSLKENLKWLGFVPDYYSINSTDIDADLVTQCKAIEVQLIVGNCNDYSEIVRTANLGVHRVITDFPIEWLAENQE